MTLPCLMLVTLGPGAMISDLNLLCYHQYFYVLDRILQVIVTYCVLLSGNPGVTEVGTLRGDDRNLRSSCIHYVLMVCSGSLLKGGLISLSFRKDPAATGG